MSQDTESFNNELYDLLKVRGYRPVPLNSQNQRVGASQQADVMEFTFTKDGEDYGKAWVSVDDASKLKVYFDDEQQDSPSTTTPGVDYDDSWTGLLKHLKQWAQRRQLSFELANRDRLGDDMRQRDYYKMKEKLGESYHPMGKKASYNDAVPNVKIVLQHNRSLEEGEARFRNVARIYLENVEGERFLAPTNKPGLARVYARHIAEGGVPNDEKWNHIKSMCEDYSKMAGFVRATRNGQFNESVAQLVQEGVDHYNNLRETLHKLAGHRGYHAYFESWSPPLMEGEGEDLSEMFMSSSLDPRIESAMPILSRLHKPSTMNEVDSLAEWADSIIEEKLELSETLADDDKPIGKGKFAYTVADASGKKKVTVLADYPDAARELAAQHWKLPNVAGIRATKKEAPESSKTTAQDTGGSPFVRASTKATADNDKTDDKKSGPGAFDTIKKNLKVPDDALTGLGKLGAALVGLAEEELSEMDKEHGSKRDFDNSRGPDKTAKPMSVKKFAKSALKSLKRGMKGWEKGMHDVDTVKAATKSLSPDQKEKALAAKAGKGSPAELQQKLIKREKNKEVDEATGYYSEKHPKHDQMTKDGYEHSIEDILGDKLHRYFKPGVSLTDLYKYDDDGEASPREKARAQARTKKANLEVTDKGAVYINGTRITGRGTKWGVQNTVFQAKVPLDQVVQTLRDNGFGDIKLDPQYSMEMGIQLEEDLGPEQKRVGQLGPTEKVKNNNIGKLVGASESKEMDPELARIIEMAKFKR